MPLTHLFKNLSSRQQPFRPLHEAGDAELLQRFVKHQEDTAFEELVRRHGPMVRSLCQRVLQHNQDTEDAFQATFLVLSRKAHSIHKRQSLASWIYKVAYRIALRARANRARRKAEESRLNEEQKEANVAEDKGDLTWLLDEEVQRLPEKYRTPVLLCYLQGQTNEEAARQLQCPTGTVKIRLMRARELLKKRLVRRGVALSIGLFLNAWTQTADAAVPPALHTATVQAGIEAAFGLPLSESQTTPNAITLAESQLKTFALAKLKLCAAVLLIVALLFSADQLLQEAHSAGSILPAEALPASPTYEKPHSPASQHTEKMAMEKDHRPAL